MSTSRHHNEWLSLLEVSGPFLSLPVLLRVFPQGLDALDKAQSAEARLAYEEWAENQSGLRPEPAIHSVWVRYVLERLLGFEKSNLLEGPAIPVHLKAAFAEHGETIRPDLVVSPGDGSARLLVTVYPFGQKLESPLRDHRWKASPAMRMMELLRATGVQIGLLTNGEQWMLVNAPRGETSSFISWYASLWFEEPLTQRAFTSLLGARRFFGVADEDTLEAMLRASVDQQQEVTDQLGYQVRRAVEVLTRALDKADQDQGRILLKGIHESDLYEAALTVMMRLVFLFSAEERGLLLLGDPIYDQNYAVSTLRAQLRETADQQGEEVLERRFDAWCRLTATFRAVHGGIQHDRVHLPAYGGSLFDPDRYPFLEGRRPSPPSHLPKTGEGGWGRGVDGEVEPLPISNRTVLHLLESLQILRVKVPGGGPAEARRLSFRALDVEQIGHVYEGLLDHIAVRADETVLGLSGTRDKEPEIPLSGLEAERQKGSASFADYLKEQTGRSTNALKRALQAEIDAFSANQLKIACNNNETVYQQVLPYAGLLRQDDFGYPTVFLAHSVYITTGATRRATGTHYTPRSLTEPIVQHTLEPLVYIGPAEGLPKEQWKLRSPAELLELNVCDMAMGSAGFLVQVIRYLSERLVEAWEQVIVELKASPLPQGDPHPSPLPQGDPHPNPLPQADPHPSPLPQGEGVNKEALSPEMLARVRELRKEATAAEALLWDLLRDRQFHGAKFRRQHPLQGFILDFYCHEFKLAIELDGGVHAEAEQMRKDVERTHALEEAGIKVLRFWNHEVMEQTDAVLQTIAACLQAPSPPGRGEATEGRRGEGLFLQITPEGKPASGAPGETIIPRDDEERMVLARRLVADRCIYGVDKNPLAVEIAKLSIWLTTMDKGRPFTFLDHALKCGDSLVGTSAEDYLRWARGWRAAEATLFDAQLQEQLEIARQKRRQLEAFQVLDVHDIDRKAQLLKDADGALARIKRGCDLLVGARLLGLSERETEDLQLKLLFPYMAGEEETSELARAPLAAAEKVHAFHWEFEFPDIFEQGGFSAFVGNPPFMGGKKISTAFGDSYQKAIKYQWKHAKGAADICAYFYLKAGYLLKRGGTFGLIATNSIAQADTREVGLEHLVKRGYKIYRAVPSRTWPGQAGVFIAVVHSINGTWNATHFINNRETLEITSFLDDVVADFPNKLMWNKGRISDGTKIYGQGFLLTPEEAELLLKDKNNHEIIKPYLIGEEINTSPTISHSRFVIDFGTRDFTEASKYTSLFKIVTEKVKPDRDILKGQMHESRYWLFWDKREELYQAISNFQTVIVCSVVSKNYSIALVPNGQVFGQSVKVFALPSSYFSILQSTIHEIWARKYSGTLKGDLSYSASDAFGTFPFLQNEESLEHLLLIGNKYVSLRSSIMTERQEGLTATYNRFHNPKEKAGDIARLRELHVEMDHAVAAAYGWSDMDLGHGFHETPQGLRYTISEPARREVLKRLLELNHERYQEEVKAGLHEKKGKKASPAKTSSSSKKTARPAKPGKAAQLSLLGEVDSAPQQEELFEVQKSSATTNEPIGDWDQCVCLECGKHLVGFMIIEHTREKHSGVAPRYRKVGG